MFKCQGVFSFLFPLCIRFVWTVALVFTSLLSIMFVEIPEPCRVFIYEHRPKNKMNKKNHDNAKNRKKKEAL